MSAGHKRVLKCIYLYISKGLKYCLSGGKMVRTIQYDIQFTQRKFYSLPSGHQLVLTKVNVKNLPNLRDPVELDMFDSWPSATTNRVYNVHACATRKRDVCFFFLSHLVIILLIYERKIKMKT